jgi:hypothetical protein
MLRDRRQCELALRRLGVLPRSNNTFHNPARGSLNLLSRAKPRVNSCCGRGPTAGGGFTVCLSYTAENGACKTASARGPFPPPGLPTVSSPLLGIPSVSPSGHERAKETAPCSRFLSREGVVWAPPGSPSPPSQSGRERQVESVVLPACQAPMVAHEQGRAESPALSRLGLHPDALPKTRCRSYCP